MSLLSRKVPMQEMGGGKIKLFKVGKFWQCFGNVGPLNEKIKLNKGE
jgi:hypothetical protein